jgi:hypothetical protein
MASIIKIGSNYAGLLTLDALATPVKDPASVTFYPYTVQKRTGAGSSVGLGNPYAVLTWKYILRAQRDQLRTFCTGVSAVVYFVLPTNDSNLTVGTYTGNMTWPLVENYYYNLLTGFSITIYNLVTYTP